MPGSLMRSQRLPTELASYGCRGYLSSTNSMSPTRANCTVKNDSTGRRLQRVNFKLTVSGLRRRSVFLKMRALVIAFVIVAICVVIHTIGLVYLAEALVARRERLAAMKTTGHAAVLLFVFAAVVTLHMIETAVWAIFYLWWDLFHDFETEWYFSLTSYTTIGYGDVTLPQTWRLLGVIEGFSGVLLCGLSTAFILIVLNAMLTSRLPGLDSAAVSGGNK